MSSRSAGELVAELLPDLDFVVLLETSKDRVVSQVLSSPAGLATGSTSAGALLRTGTSALSSRGSSSVVSPEESGTRLYDALLPGAVATVYRRSLEIAKQAGCSLRLVIRTAEPDLMALPWELVCDRGTTRFLAQRRRTPVVRGVSVPGYASPLEPAELPLRVVVMAAVDDPTEDHEAWRSMLRHSTPAGDSVSLTMLDGLPTLVNRLRIDAPHVVHLRAAVRRDADTGGVVVDLPDERGSRRLLGSSYLGAILGDARDLRLVVLYPPRSGLFPVSPETGLLAAELVRQGVPCVVAMTFAQEDVATTAFVAEVHDLLLAGHTAERAVAEARIATLSMSELAWAAPAVYVPYDESADRAFTPVAEETEPPDLSHSQYPQTPAPTPSLPAPSTDRREPGLRGWLKRQFGGDDVVLPAPAVDRAGQQVAALLACQTAEDIAADALWADFDPAADPYGMQQRLREVSADVSAALRTTVSRISAALLDGAGTKLLMLQVQLQGQLGLPGGPPQTASLLHVAISWQTIVSAESARLTARSLLMEEIDSPYVVGVPLRRQSVFVGRRDLSERLQALLPKEVTPALLLYGQRRMGKTSLLNNLGQFLPTDVVPMFVDLQGPPAQADSEASFLYQLARAMARSATLNRPDVLLDVPPREAFSTDPFDRFSGWLDDVQARLADRTILLMLDEFEALERAFRADRLDPDAVLGMLRHLIQHRPGMKVLLAGSHTLDTYASWSSYLINVQVLKVDYLDRAAAEELVCRPVPDFPLEYDADALAVALSLTRGHPYLLQLLCAEVVAAKNAQPPSQRRLATIHDVLAAADAALVSGSMYFTDVERNQIGPAARDLGRRLARGEANPGPADAAALRELRQRDLVETGADGSAVFQVELIRRWFERADPA